MIGRDGELAKLKRAIERLTCLSAGRRQVEGRGKIISLIGEAGIGKSRLVSELKAYLERREEEIEWKNGRKEEQSEFRIPNSEFLWLEGRCVSYGKQMSYFPFLEILRTYFDIKQNDDDATVVEKISTKVCSLSLASEIVPYMAGLLSVDVKSEEIMNLTAEQLRYKTFVSLRALLRKAAETRPLVIAVEDMHWMDDASYDLLSFLLESVKKVPILFLCIYRPERDEHCFRLRQTAPAKYADDYDEVALWGLSSEDSRRLIRTILNAAPLPSNVEESLFYIVARGRFGEGATIEPILGEYQVIVKESAPFYIGELGDIPEDAPDMFYPRHGQMITDTTPTFEWEAFQSDYLGELVSPWAYEINLTFPDGVRLTAFPIPGEQTSLDYSTAEWDIEPPEELTPGAYSLSIHSNHVVVERPSKGGFSFEHHRIIELWVVAYLTVEIDIKPGSYPNAINLNKKGLIPVAILTTPNFDATTVDALSVQFGPDGATEAHGEGHIEDVDGDGDKDLVLHFETQETGIKPGDTEASFTGMTFDGTIIYGSDSIVTVPKQ